MFFSETGLAPHNSAPGKKGGVVRVLKGVLYKLQVFVELLRSGVCESKIVRQSQTLHMSYVTN